MKFKKKREEEPYFWPVLEVAQALETQQALRVGALHLAVVPAKSTGVVRVPLWVLQAL